MLVYLANTKNLKIN